MLLELTIRQFAIIKELSVGFKEGLNVITGETGAGKSIIIDAIQLIIGGRGSTEFIRNEAEKAEIEGLFDISNNHDINALLSSLGFESSEDDFLIIKRELLRNGKSICRVNGQFVTLTTLKEIGQYLLSLHSQNQHQNLLVQEKQLALLDAYGDKRLKGVKTSFEQAYSRYALLKRQVNELYSNEKEVTQRIDILQYQKGEIGRADLKPNEDEILSEQRNKIKHAEKINNNLINAYQSLHNDKGINDQLFNIKGLLEQVAGYDQEIASIAEQVGNAYYQIEDATLQLNNLVTNLDFNQVNIEQIEERLSLIHLLKRKYGDSVNVILEYAVTIEEELATLTNREENLTKLQKELDRITKEVAIHANELSSLRTETAKELSRKIEQELRDLQMANAKFVVKIDYEEDSKGITIGDKTLHLSSTGIDKINFLISPNLGEPLKPLNKIASGGELSRVMLAIQTILANKDDITTIIFDEIDTGVSGRAAQAIAEKLAVVAKDKQVFVVTHLPQVASMADNHYLIEKKEKDNITYTEITYLEEEKRIDELSRMLSGVEVTTLTKKHAKEMIDKALIHKSN